MSAVNMEGGIDANGLLEFIEFQIFPSLSRYEASICLGNNYEVAASGSLEPLLLHSPKIKALQSRGSDGTFKLAAPEDVNGARWFTKSSLLRFLQIITSSEVLNATTALRSEISQLEEAHSFHISLYEKGSKKHFSGEESDYEAEGFPKDGSGTVPSNDSKNELLRAMYLRLTALREELCDAFAKAAVITFSKEEIKDIEKLCSLFGATNLRKSLCNLVELSQENRAETNRESDTICEAKEDITPVSKQSNLPVKYGWSPAKLAEIERQNSSESGESSDSSMEEQPSVERSRTLIRSASPRRSASPMRRVQIGRSGSRRTTPLTIKSLNFIPKSQNDELQQGTNNAEEAAEQPVTKPETSNSRIISVQDAISLFESKQKDQIQKTNSFSNASIGSKKPVLRRWSTGLSGASNAYRDSGSDNSVDLPSNDLRNGSSEVKPDHDPSSMGQNVETAEIDTEPDQYSYSIGQIVEPTEVHTEPDGAPQSESNDMISESVGSNQKESASAEWSRQKEAELDELLTKMMETKQQVKYRKDSNLNSKTDEVLGEKKGGLYGNYKEKRTEKLQSKKIDRKHADKEKRNHSGNKRNANVQKSKKTTLPSTDNNTTEEISKPSVVRKASSKTSPLPATRKSWPSAPSIRTTGISEIVSASTTATSHRKSQPAPTVTGSSSTKTQMKTKSSLKATQNDKSKTVKDVNVKNQQPSEKNPTSTKAKVQNADAKSPISGKPSLYSKVTKKSSVVPLEPKPFLRKGSKVGSGVSVSPISKKKVSAQPDESTKEELKDQILPGVNDIVISASSDIVDLEPLNDHVINSPDKSLDTHNQVAIVEDDVAEDELTISISPAAWIDTEEHEDQTENDNRICQIELSPPYILPTTMPSPHIRQSLSQMLLEEETSEPDLNEWGNADSRTTTTVFRKDEAPKGLKKLLKFARKSKTTTTADGNSSGWSSPSVFSEGEDDGEESKSLGKRSSSDNLLLKLATLNNGHQRSSYQDKDLATHGLFGRPNMNKAISESSLSGKMLDNRNSTTISNTKATRPFFSLSAFRGSSK